MNPAPTTSAEETGAATETDVPAAVPLQAASELRGAALLLASAGPGTRTLVLSSDPGPWLATARWFGGQAMPAGDLLRAGTDAISRISDDPLDPELPERSFDTLVLDGPARSSTTRSDHLLIVQSRRDELLRLCARLLRSEGMLLLLIGRPEAPTRAIDEGCLLPREEGRIVRVIRAASRHLRHFLHTARESRDWIARLERHGFEPITFRLDPVASDWSQAIPIAPGPPPHCAGGRGLSAPSADLTKRKLSLAQRLRGADLLVVARHRGGQAAAPLSTHLSSLATPIRRSIPPAPASRTVLDEILTAEALAGRCSGSLHRVPNSQALWFIAGRRFFKIPLSRSGLDRLERSVATVRSLEGHPIALHIPRPVQIREARGIRYLSCPAVLDHSHEHLTEEELIRLLTALAEGSRFAPLSRTGLWRRLFRPEIGEVVGELGYGELWRRSRDELADRLVLTGLGHGDLHLGNLLATPERIYLIDWDRFDPETPLFLDEIEACGALVRRRLRSPPEDTVLLLAQLLAREDPNLPLRSRFLGGRDALDSAERVRCYLLAQVEERIEDGAIANPGVRRACEDWLAYAETTVGMRRPAIPGWLRGTRLA